MTINVPEKLKKLALLLPVDLYIVGGYVRDCLLNIESGDIDICSPLTVQEIEKFLAGSDFEILPVNLRVGTAIVKSGDFKAEYTCFRSDSYPEDSGAHSPQSVNFISDIKVDALRRDFTANAVYFDIKKEQIIDIVGGVEDIENKVLRAADIPEKVFGEDGLRVLRLVRFAAELGFSVEQKTFDAAKMFSSRLKDIAPERIRVELDRILIADTAHPNLSGGGAHLKAVRLLDELGALAFLFPELTAMRNLQQKAKYHRYNAFEHSIKAFEVAPPQVRLAALLHDIGKLPTQVEQGNMHGHDLVGADMARDRLTKLKYPKTVVDRVVKLIRLHMYDLRGETKEGKIRLFIARNRDIIEDLFLLQRADCEASMGERPTHTERMERIYAEMKMDGTPFSLSDLKVNGHDTENFGIIKCARGQLLQELLENAILNANLRTREAQLDYLKRKSQNPKIVFQGSGKEKETHYDCMGRIISED